MLQYNIVGNKAKGRISKRVFQENKARQIFRKRNNSCPLIRNDISTVNSRSGTTQGTDKKSQNHIL